MLNLPPGEVLVLLLWRREEERFWSLGCEGVPLGCVLVGSGGRLWCAALGAEGASAVPSFREWRSAPAVVSGGLKGEGGGDGLRREGRNEALMS